MGKVFIYTIAGLMAVLLLFILSLALGSVSIPIQDIIAILLGKGEGVANPSYSYIILESRLPQAFTALLAGAALSVSGLLLQTTFRNPLAGPSVLGISSAASLGVAFVVLLSGAIGGTALSSFGIIGNTAITIAAIFGAMLVMSLIVFLSHKVEGNVTLLITGVLIVVPQNSGPETAAPFLLRYFVIIPVILVIQDITRHHRVVNLISFSTHDVQSTMYLAVTIIQFFVNNQLLFRS